MKYFSRDYFFPTGPTKNGLLAIPIVASWSLYPWALSWLYPNLVRIVFGASLVAVAILMICFTKRQSWHSNRDEKTLGILVASYLLTCIAASLIFNSADSDLLLRYMLKFVFLVLLTSYISKDTIFFTADIYSYVCLGLVVFSMMGVTAIAFRWVDLTMINVVWGVDHVGEMVWSFSGFDGTARIFPESNQYVRMQSLALEPGAFALALLPTLYWLAIVRERFVPAVIIALGISASWSFGALLAMVLATGLLVISKHVASKVKIFLLCAIVFFFVSHIVFSWVVDPASTSASSSGSPSKPGIDLITGGDKSVSKQQRVDELLQVFSFVSDDFWGAGIGAGRDTLNSSISVGYANVFADTGILGGTVYSLTCVFFALIALKCVLAFGRMNPSSTDSKALLALALSVLTCLFFGLQREQPDASFWHMWVYASFIVMYRVSSNSKALKL